MYTYLLPRIIHGCYCGQSLFVKGMAFKMGHKINLCIFTQKIKRTKLMDTLVYMSIQLFNEIGG